MSSTVPRGDQASQSVSESAAEDGERRGAVDSRGLRFDPTAGEELRTLLEDHLGKVDDWLRRAGNLTRHAAFGQNPVADAMAAKFANRADGAENSLTDVLTHYREVLQQAHDAVSDSLRTYTDIDASVAERLRKLI